MFMIDRCGFRGIYTLFFLDTPIWIIWDKKYWGSHTRFVTHGDGQWRPIGMESGEFWAALATQVLIQISSGLWGPCSHWVNPWELNMIHVVNPCKSNAIHRPFGHFRSIWTGSSLEATPKWGFSNISSEWRCSGGMNSINSHSLNKSIVWSNPKSNSLDMFRLDTFQWFSMFYC